MANEESSNEWLEALRLDLARLKVPKETVLEVRCAELGHPLLFVVAINKMLVPVSIEQGGGTSGLRITMDQDGTASPASLRDLSGDVRLRIGPCACGNFEALTVQNVRDALETQRGNGKRVKVTASPLR